MNKNLFTMSSLFALALGMASCSSGDDVTSSPLEMAQQNVKAFGTRSTEINMYLGNVKVPQTRGVDVNGNMWSYMPEYPTDAEKRGILEYVRITRPPRCLGQVILIITCKMSLVPTISIAILTGTMPSTMALMVPPTWIDLKSRRTITTSCMSTISMPASATMLLPIMRH